MIKTEYFPPKIRNHKRMPALVISVQNCTGCSIKAIREEIELRHPNEK